MSENHLARVQGDQSDCRRMQQGDHATVCSAHGCHCPVVVDQCGSIAPEKMQLKTVTRKPHRLQRGRRQRRRLQLHPQIADCCLSRPAPLRCAAWAQQSCMVTRVMGYRPSLLQDCTVRVAIPIIISHSDLLLLLATKSVTRYAYLTLPCSSRLQCTGMAEGAEAQGTRPRAKYLYLRVPTSTQGSHLPHTGFGTEMTFGDPATIPVQVQV